MKDNKGVILIDLDGTLAFYDGWKGEDNIGDPIPEMVDNIKEAHLQGYRLKIFTARVNNHVGLFKYKSEEDYLRNYRILWKWLVENNIMDYLDRVEPIATTKNWEVVEIWDDRAVRIELNTGKKLN